MSRAAIYARFSTDQQREASIEDQFRMCRRTAEAAGLTITAQFEDRGISGGTADRPGYQTLLLGARAKLYDVIVVEDMSRLWRSRAEFGPRSAELEDLGVHLLTCTGDDTRRDGWGLVLGIKSAINEHARREISYRTKRGLEGRAIAGMPTGSSCYGYREGKLHAPEAAIVLRIFVESAAGYSVRHIANGLNAAGILSPRGGKWGATTVHRILRNRRYTGTVIWGATEVKGSAQNSKRTTRIRRPEPLVTRQDPTLQIIGHEVFDRVNARDSQS